MKKSQINLRSSRSIIQKRRGKRRTFSVIGKSKARVASNTLLCLILYFRGQAWLIQKQTGDGAYKACWHLPNTSRISCPGSEKKASSFIVIRYTLAPPFLILEIHTFIHFPTNCLFSMLPPLPYAFRCRPPSDASAPVDAPLFAARIASNSSGFAFSMS